MCVCVCVYFLYVSERVSVLCKGMIVVIVCMQDIVLT